MTVLALLAALLLAGCGSAVSLDNFNKIQVGMTQQQVEAIIGPGKEQASSSVTVPGMSAGGVSVSGMSMSAKVLAWQDGSRVITITLQDGKVIGKAQSGL